MDSAFGSSILGISNSKTVQKVFAKLFDEDEGVRSEHPIIVDTLSFV